MTYMTRIRRYLLLCMAVLSTGVVNCVAAQDFALKSNLVSDGLMNINFGAEVATSLKWTIDVSGEFNGWTLSHGRRWKHWALQPEGRYWFCDRFSGHFVGIHAHGGQFNIGGFDGKYNLFGTDSRKLTDSRYEGWFIGAGIAYGYVWILGRHWNLEAEIGFGYSYSRYDRFRCAGCGKKVEEDKSHDYVGPTKAAVNLIYVF